MTVKEYNSEFLPKIEGAQCFIKNIPHAIAKSADPLDTEMQFKCIGWNYNSVEIIEKSLEFYREHVCKNLEKPKKEEDNLIIKFVDGDFLLIEDGGYGIFNADRYLSYALNHRFNVKFMATSSSKSVEVIKMFSENGFEVTYGVDKEVTFDGACVIEHVYAIFWNKI